VKKSGGIVALIGGIFGTIAAIVTLFAGGLVAGLEGASAALNETAVDNAASSQIATFAILGLIASFSTIILGAISMGAKSRLPGFLLIACAIIGAITGGTLVAVCMVLTLVGGILATIGTKKPLSDI
jgi:hypothetical protein